MSTLLSTVDTAFHKATAERLLQQGLQQLHKNREQQHLTPEEKVAYWKAAQGFEAIFSYMVLKEMRKTVPSSLPLPGGGILNAFADLQLAQQIGKAGQFGIAKLAYEYFTDSPYDPAEIIAAQQQQHDLHTATVSDTPLSAQPAEPIAGRPPAETDAAVHPPPSTAPLAPHIFAQLHAADGMSPLTQEILRYHQRLAPYLSIIHRAAAQYRFDPALLKAVILAESDGDPTAVSAAGAKGLMQLMDQTAQMLGITDPFDPAENIFGGTAYLASLRDHYDDLWLALAAYNAGPGAVDRYNGIPPFPETRQYLHHIHQLATFFGFTFPPSPYMTALLATSSP